MNISLTCAGVTGEVIQYYFRLDQGAGNTPINENKYLSGFFISVRY
ncbi:MAG: hypothetical protein ACQET8_22535 [Bacillota bacterium]